MLEYEDESWNEVSRPLREMLANHGGDADSFVGENFLKYCTAVYNAFVWDVESSRWQWYLEGSPGEPRKKTVSEYVLCGKQMRSAQSVDVESLWECEGDVPDLPARGSADACRWYAAWVSEVLDVATQTRSLLAATPQQQLQIRLQFRHRDGRRTTVTAGSENTKLSTR